MQDSNASRVGLYKELGQSGLSDDVERPDSNTVEYIDNDHNNRVSAMAKSKEQLDKFIEERFNASFKQNWQKGNGRTDDQREVIRDGVSS